MMNVKLNNIFKQFYKNIEKKLEDFININNISLEDWKCNGVIKKELNGKKEQFFYKDILILTNIINIEMKASGETPIIKQKIIENWKYYDNFIINTKG